MAEVINKLAELRKRAGFSAARLAEEAGVTRQAIYAIEAGTYMPNTSVSLLIARALYVTVDDIFRLEPAPPTKVEIAICETDVAAGTAVQVAAVEGKLVAVRPSPAEFYLPASDAVVESARAGRAKVRLHRPDPDLENRLVIAGCDPSASLLARYLQGAGVDAVLVHRNSTESLELLKEKRVHVAGNHLQSSSKSVIVRDAAILGFVTWREGLVVARGNPKRIKSGEDLARKNVRFVNREKGAGTRALLDRNLQKVHLEPKQLRGYDSEARGHMAAARKVAAGQADCCVATEAAARAFGLTFVPLATARYDFFLRGSYLDLPGVRTLLDTITRADFRRELTAIAGYDTTITGTRLQ